MDLVTLCGMGVLVAVGFVGGRGWEQEAIKERQRREEEEERDLGIIGPISVLWAAGRLTDEGAEQEVRRSCITIKTPLSRWRGMSKAEKLSLAERFVRLSKDPVWLAHQEKASRAADALCTELGWKR